MAKKFTATTRKIRFLPVIFIILLLAALIFLVIRVQDTKHQNNATTTDASEGEELVLQFEAESGAISAPFQKKDGYIYQTTKQDSVAGGGVAKYDIIIPETGVYTLRGKVKTPTDGRNSFFVNIDKMPTDPADIWDIPIFTDFTWKRVSARGNGTFDNNQYQPRYFNLTKGKHTVYIVGREPNTFLERLQVHLQHLEDSNDPDDAPVTPVGNDLLPNGDFETGNLDAFRSLQKCCSYSITVVKDPVRAGKYAARFELNYTDPLVASSKRTEITSPDAEYNKDYWYKFSVYLPNDWQVDTSREIVDQWHNHPNKGEEYRNPVLSLRVDGKNWGLRSVWDSSVITKINEYDGDVYVNLGPYQKGVWTDWEVHARWSYKSDGFLEVFKNGKSVYKRSGPNTYNDPTGPYFKFGIYKWDWRTMATNTKKRVVYQDNVSIVKGN